MRSLCALAQRSDVGVDVNGYAGPRHRDAGELDIDRGQMCTQA
jgi:hypothetical protein